MSQVNVNNIKKWVGKMRWLAPSHCHKYIKYNKDFLFNAGLTQLRIIR
jgi:hypothetical protein